MVRQFRLLTGFLMLVLVLALLTVLPVSLGAQEVSGFPGEGTAESPYRIETAEQMRLLASRVNAGETFAGRVFLLLADLNFENAAFTPIGTEEHPFAGTFDGNGFTVSGLRLESGRYLGLFGCVTGTVRRLGVRATLARSSGTGAVYAGAVCGLLKGQASQVYGNLSGTVGSENTVYAGSVTGYVYYTGVLEDAAGSGSVNAASTAAVYAGGVAGAIGGGRVKRAVSDAAVSAAGAQAYAGGIAGGLYYGTLTRGIFTGTVSAAGAENKADALVAFSHRIPEEAETDNRAEIGDLLQGPLHGEENLSEFGRLFGLTSMAECYAVAETLYGGQKTLSTLCGAEFLTGLGFSRRQNGDGLWVMGGAGVPALYFIARQSEDWLSFTVDMDNGEPARTLYAAAGATVFLPEGLTRAADESDHYTFLRFQTETGTVPDGSFLLTQPMTVRAVWQAEAHTYETDESGAHVCSVCGYVRSRDSFCPGDVNGDGVFNTSDVLLLLGWLSGKGTECILENADYNQDGTVDSRDALLMLQALAR